MRLRSTTTLIAAALVAGAIAAPAAFAGVYLEPGTHDASHSDTTAPALAVPPILPAPRADLAALNRAKVNELGRVSKTSGHVTGPYSNAELAAYPTVGHAAGVTAPASPAAGGFDYGDAAIGAGVIAAVALLITAGALTVRRRSQPRTS